VVRKAAVGSERKLQAKRGRAAVMLSVDGCRRWPWMVCDAGSRGKGAEEGK
jgi:hypothetical protein